MLPTFRQVLTLRFPVQGAFWENLEGISDYSYTIFRKNTNFEKLPVLWPVITCPAACNKMLEMP
jgi:hypothetical protein